MEANLKSYRYFLLTALILFVDQITKLLVVIYIPLNTIAWNFGGDFFRIIHVRNLGMLFSLGHNLPFFLRVIVLIIIPIGVLFALSIYLVRGQDITKGQRWLFAVILGGGLGNIIDRVFRPEGVVDFLDFKFYGLFGLERWPTFNVADSSLVVSTILLGIFLIVQEIKSK